VPERASLRGSACANVKLGLYGDTEVCRYACTTVQSCDSEPHAVMRLRAYPLRTSALGDERTGRPALARTSPVSDTPLRRYEAKPSRPSSCGRINAGARITPHRDPFARMLPRAQPTNDVQGAATRIRLYEGMQLPHETTDTRLRNYATVRQQHIPNPTRQTNRTVDAPRGAFCFP
jgi:hypothetical protein